MDQDVLKVAGDSVLAAGPLLRMATGDGVEVLGLLALVTKHIVLLNEVISENLKRRGGAMFEHHPAVGRDRPNPKGWRNLTGVQGRSFDFGQGSGRIQSRAQFRNGRGRAVHPTGATTEYRDVGHWKSGGGAWGIWPQMSSFGLFHQDRQDRTRRVRRFALPQVHHARL